MFSATAARTSRSRAGSICTALPPKQLDPFIVLPTKAPGFVLRHKELLLLGATYREANPIAHLGMPRALHPDKLGRKIQGKDVPFSIQTFWNKCMGSYERSRIKTSVLLQRVESREGGFPKALKYSQAAVPHGAMLRWWNCWGSERFAVSLLL